MLLQSLRNVGRWLDKRFRHLVLILLLCGAIYMIARAVRGDWGVPIFWLAACTLLLVISNLLNGFWLLLGIAVVDRLRQNRPLVGALPDVIQAATISAEIARGDKEPLPPPIVPDDNSVFEQQLTAEMAALTARAQNEYQRHLNAMEGEESS